MEQMHSRQLFILFQQSRWYDHFQAFSLKPSSPKGCFHLKQRTGPWPVRSLLTSAHVGQTTWRCSLAILGIKCSAFQHHFQWPMKGFLGRGSVVLGSNDPLGYHFVGHIFLFRRVSWASTLRCKSFIGPTRPGLFDIDAYCMPAGKVASLNAAQKWDWPFWGNERIIPCLHGTLKPFRRLRGSLYVIKEVHKSVEDFSPGKQKIRGMRGRENEIGCLGILMTLVKAVSKKVAGRMSHLLAKGSNEEDAVKVCLQSSLPEPLMLPKLALHALGLNGLLFLWHLISTFSSRSSFMLSSLAQINKG